MKDCEYGAVVVNTPERPTGEVAAQLRSVVVPLARLLRQQTGGLLTATQGSVLGTVARHGPLNVSDLAAREQLSLPMISKVVAALEWSAITPPSRTWMTFFVLSDHRGVGIAGWLGSAHFNKLRDNLATTGTVLLLFTSRVPSRSRFLACKQHQNLLTLEPPVSLQG